MKVSDGETIDFVAPAGGVVAGEFYRIDGWNLFAVTDAAVGETFAGEVRNGPIHRVRLPDALTGAKGTFVYIPPAGETYADFTATRANNVPALFITEAAAAHVCEGIVLNGTPILTA